MSTPTTNTKGSQDPLLIQWLAEHDAACPACGYGLRGIADPVCPECKTPLHLEVASVQTNLRSWMFAVISCAIGFGFDAVVAILTLTIFLTNWPLPTEWQYYAVLAGFMAGATVFGLAMVLILRGRAWWVSRSTESQWTGAWVIFVVVGLVHGIVGAYVVSLTI